MTSLPVEDELHFAILQRNSDAVRKIVASGAVDLNKEHFLLGNSRPQRSLVDAISVGYSMTELLLNLGADPSLPVSMNMPAPLFALFTAAAAEPTASCHCGHDADDPDAVSLMGSNPPFEALKAIIDSGKVDLAHQYPAKGGGKTLLDFATAAENADLIQYLRERSPAM